MAKPRVFVSSTYYDLRHIRDSLEAFINSFGYEPVLFESGDIPFQHGVAIDESCYAEIQNCHMFVLIIGGRYGSPITGQGVKSEEDEEKLYEAYNSITKQEYETARQRDIPIFIFVDANVFAEYETYKQNRDNTSIQYVHVDSVNVFRLLDDILAQRRNNFIKDFQKLDDITSWLREQWAGLFADTLSKKTSESTLKDMATQISELRTTAGALKVYTESIMKKIQPQDFQGIISKQARLLRDTRIKQFAKDPLIIYLLQDGKPATSPGRLFTAFQRSTTLSEFLHNAKLSESFITSFLEDLEPVALRSYDRLAQRYFDSDEQSEEEITD